VYNANRPRTHLEAVSIRSVEQHLGCDIIWGAANGLVPLPIHVVAGADELDHEEVGLWLGEAATVAKDVHEGTRGA